MISRLTISRLTGAGDCAIIAVAVAENKNVFRSGCGNKRYGASQEGGGIRTIDLKSYLDGKGYAHAPLKKVVISLEDLWHSDFIAVGDAGVIMVAGEGDGVASHAVGFREGRMHVADPILTSQLYASAEVVGVYFHKTSDTAAIARLVGNQATQTPVVVHERIMTEVELEALQAALGDRDHVVARKTLECGCDFRRCLAMRKKRRRGQRFAPIPLFRVQTDC